MSNNNLKRKMFDDFDIPSTPGSTAPHSTVPTATPESTNLMSPPLSVPVSTFQKVPISTQGSFTPMLSTVSSVGSTTSTFTPFSALNERPTKKPFTTSVERSVPINYRKFLSSAFKVFEEETLINIETKQMKSHMNGMLDQCKAKKASQGDKLMLLLRQLLDYIPKSYKGWERSKMQKTFHRNFMQATCLHLYRNDKDIDMDKIMRMNQFENLKQQVLCLTPRRFGKTTSVAMFVAAYGVAIPNSEQCIFSTGRRASQKLLELIRDMIKAGKHADMFIKCNGETMLLQGPTPLDVRKIHSYPSCAKTLRGCGGDVVYMEEAAFMALDVFFEVIVPLLEMETTALIAISTPLDGMNFYSEMFDLKGGDGQPLFNTLRIGLSCAKCQAAGKAAECTHMNDVIPPWKSAAKFDMVKAIYGDRKDLLARESMGQITSDQASVFSEKLVNRLMERPEYALKNPAKYIFLGVDPNGGGSSDMAIVTMTMIENNVIITGMETHPARSHDEIEMLLLQHVRALRGHPDLKDAWIIFFPENNLGQEASHMAHMVKDERKVYTYYEKGKAGVCTTHERKEKYTVNCLQYFNQEAVHFINDTVCANPYRDANERLEQVKKEFKKQLLQFQKMVIAPAQAYQLAKIVYTGKVKEGLKDDIAMTLLFTTYWAQQFLNRKIQCPYESFVA